VSGLTLGDYLLWNWSLAGDHGALALVSGLTLPPLALACASLLALNLARLIAGSTFTHAGRRRAPRSAPRPQAPGGRVEGSPRPGRSGNHPGDRPRGLDLLGLLIRQARRISRHP
jgi:hypothetical protein